MIILNEDERGIVAGLLEDRVGKEAIDLAIRVPVVRGESGAREGDVAERPESRIRWWRATANQSP